MIGWALLYTFFPELKRFEKDEIRLAAIHRAFRNVHFTAWSIMAGIVTVVAIILAKEFAPKLTQHPVVEAVILVLGPSIPLLSSMWMVRRSVCVELRRQLNAEGNPTCLECGYDLRGQIDLRCPECGAAFERLISEEKAQQSGHE